MRGFHLHGGVVEGDERREQVQVASSEDQGKKDLTLPRNTCKQTAERSDEQTAESIHSVKSLNKI